MVTVSKKIRITDLTNFPVSVDGTSGTPSTGVPGYPYYYQPIPNFPVGIPGTDTGNISDPITDPHPGSCDAGYVKDSNGYCVPINSLPACPSGQARDVNTGLCVTTTTNPPPTTTGIGLLASATVPPSSVPGESITILTSIKNTGTVNSYSFGARVRIGSLSIDIFSPLTSIAAGNTVVISTRITLPGNTPLGAVAGTIDVVRQVSTIPASVVIDDSEPFTLNIVTNVPYPCSSLPACPTGYHRDSACNCVSDTTTPPTTTNTSFYTLVRRVGDGNTHIYTKAEIEAYGVVVNQYNTNLPSAITCTTAGCLLGWVVVNVPTNTYNNSFLTGLGFTPGVTIPGSGGGTTTGGTAVITTNKTTYKKGQTITASGNGFTPGESVRLYLTIEGTLVQEKSVTANSTGGIAGTLIAGKIGGGHTQAKGRTSGKAASKHIIIQK